MEFVVESEKRFFFCQNQLILNSTRNSLEAFSVELVDGVHPENSNIAVENNRKSQVESKKHL